MIDPLPAIAGIIAGLILLVLGGEAIIRGTVGIARRLGVSELVIGLTLVGFGTSTPELVTSIDAARAGSPGIALGNVIGSNIGNVLLIFAVVTLIRPVAAHPMVVGRDAVVALCATVLLAGVGLALGEISRPMGGLMTLLLVAYLAYILRFERRAGSGTTHHEEEVQVHDPAPSALWVSIPLALGGLALLIAGADLLVEGAMALARGAGVSETVVGIAIVAVGTSLPEFVATLAATLKGRGDIAFGNIIGSNIYNILGVLGITTIVRPLAIPAEIGLVDWAILVGSATLILVFARTGARVVRWEGAVLFGIYGAYVGYLLRH